MSDFQFTDISAITSKKNRGASTINLNELYKQAHSELSLQQTKRDQIISIYLSLGTVLVPLLLSTSYIQWVFKGVIFLVLGLIGLLLSFIVIRYKVYKDVYWICCQTIPQLQSYPSEEIDKQLVQGIFYNVLKKKGRGYVKEKDGKRTFRSFKFFKSNIFSAETLLYVTLIILVSIVAGLGMALTCGKVVLISAVIGICFGILIFAFLLWRFFFHCKKIYQVLVDGSDQSFNYVFSKAWFLHFYEL